MPLGLLACKKVITMIMKLSVILLLIIVLVAIPAVILANSNDDEEEVIDMNGKENLPLIDTMKPAVTRTATFALG
jgi:hypothetical protein